MAEKILSPDTKDQLAMALVLLKDFKSNGKFDPDIILYVLKLADAIGITKEYQNMISKIPPMKIEQRY